MENNSSVGSRQKRRRVQQALATFALENGQHDSEDNDHRTDENAENGAREEELHFDEHPVQQGVSTETTVSDEFVYDSDEEPLDSSDDEHELPSSDDESINLNNLLSESEDEEQSTIDFNSADQSCGLKKKLASWVVDHRVKQNAVDSLLSDVLPVLPEYDSLKMPKTCRTLVQTPKKTPLKKVEPGSYFHFGLARGIKHMIDKHGIELTEIQYHGLRGLVNTDGLPVAKASGSQVWPIQLRFLEECTAHWPPMVLGVYHGHRKPLIVNEYLEDFVTEALQLKQTGYRYRNQLLKINIFGFSCDAPANALMKHIKIHTGYESCPKCVVYGNWAGRVVLLETTAQLRTHASFIQQTQEGHHKGRSILEQLGIDMIDAFAID